MMCCTSHKDHIINHVSSNNTCLRHCSCLTLPWRIHHLLASRRRQSPTEGQGLPPCRRWSQWGWTWASLLMQGCRHHQLRPVQDIMPCRVHPLLTLTLLALVMPSPLSRLSGDGSTCRSPSAVWKLRIFGNGDGRNG